MPIDDRLEIILRQLEEDTPDRQEHMRAAIGEGVLSIVPVVERCLAVGLRGRWAAERLPDRLLEQRVRP